MKEDKEIPEGWAVDRIGAISIINPALPNKDDIDRNIEVQFLPMKLVEEKSNKIHLTETRQLNEVLKGSYTPFIDGDIIFAKVTPCMENGKIAIVNKLVNGIGFGSSEFHVLRTSAAVLNKYLYYFIGNDRFRNEAQRAMTGAVGLRRVPKQFIEEYQLPLPPLPEQHRIVSKIEELFSSLDKGIESLKAAQAQLKVYRQAVLKWAFEGRLTNEGVKEGELPEGWEADTIRNLCHNIKVGIVIKPTNFYATSGKGIPAFRSANVREFRVNDSDWVYFTEEGHKANLRTQLSEGDVLIVRSGYPGTSCVVPKNFHGSNAIDILIAIPNERKLLSKFLCAFNNSPFGKGLFKENSRGVAQKHLNVGEYSKLLINFPSIKEQEQIVAEIETRLSVCDKLEESIGASLLQAEALRQSILKRAFEGKLVPQDPADEPAGVLLERIRGEREKEGKKSTNKKER